MSVSRYPFAVCRGTSRPRSRYYFVDCSRRGRRRRPASRALRVCRVAVGLAARMETVMERAEYKLRQADLLLAYLRELRKRSRLICVAPPTMKLTTNSRLRRSSMHVWALRKAQSSSYEEVTELCDDSLRVLGQILGRERSIQSYGDCGIRRPPRRRRDGCPDYDDSRRRPRIAVRSVPAPRPWTPSLTSHTNPDGRSSERPHCGVARASTLTSPASDTKRAEPVSCSSSGCAH